MRPLIEKGGRVFPTKIVGTHKTRRTCHHPAGRSEDRRYVGWARLGATWERWGRTYGMR